MIRMALQFLAGTVLVLGSLWNLHDLEARIGALEPRAEEDVTVIENQFRPIDFWLIVNSPQTKRLGYFTPLTLAGKPPDDFDGTRWAQLRYAIIPRILVRGMDEDLIIGYFKPGEPIPPVPDTLIQLYDPGTRMILYKRKTAK